MSNRRNRRRSPRPFHLTWVLIICLTPVLAAWFLIPRDLELAERLAEDGHPDRALSMLWDMLPRNITDSVEDKKNWNFPVMKTLLTNDGSTRSRGEKKTRMMRILIQLSDEPEKNHSLLSAHPKKLSEGVARDFYKITATTALRQNKPRLASEIYKTLDSTHGVDESLLMDAVQSHRFSGAPRLALDLMYQHAERRGIAFSNLDKEKRMMVIALHRELNEGGKAFGLLKEEFERAKTETQRQELVQLLSTTAIQSNLFAESLPILKNYVAQTQASQLTWQQLAERTEPHPTDADFIKYSSTLAQQLLWSGQLNPAFDMYRKLAMMDNLEALEQCVTMTPWVNRPKDLGHILAVIKDLPTGKGYEKLLVNALCLDGKFDQANTRLTSWINEGHKEEPSMRQTLADIAFEQREYDKAGKLYREALEVRLKSDDTKGVTTTLASLARTTAITGDFKNALEVYRQIPKEQHDAKTVGDYLYLATSMNSNGDVVRALNVKGVLNKGKKISPYHYIELAGAFEVDGNWEGALKYLKEGLQACPNSHKIALKIVEIEKSRGRHHDALEFLYSNYHKDDPRFGAQLLGLAIKTKRQSEALKFLQLTDPTAKAWPESLRLSLANLYESNFQNGPALAIYDDVSPNGFEAPKYRIRAQLAFQNKKMEEAWEHQTKYLSMIPRPTHEELVFMGDLHRFTGRQIEAANAYTAALASIQRLINRDTVGLASRM